MISQICRLSKVLLCNTFSINEMIHTKDAKKRNRFIMMIVIWTLLAVMLASYIVQISKAFVDMEMGDIIPMYLYTVSSLLILCFSFFKAGNVIFAKASYEMTVSLPVSDAAIVISRFLTMYITDLLISLITVLPGMVIYNINMDPGPAFYIYAFAGIIILPLIPLTAATAIGAIITAVSSRMRHKSLTSAGLSVLLVAGVLLLNIQMQSSAENMSQESMHDLLSVFTDKIESIFPLALWYNNASVHASLRDFLLLAIISAGIFIIMIAFLQKYFGIICSALNSSCARNNYKMQSLNISSQVKSMWSKEIRRYFSSSVYVVNTMMGYLMMVVLSVAVCVIGKETIADKLGMPYTTIDKAFPIILAIIGNILPVTASSISLEGKQLWLIQTLPLKNEVIYKAKILVNLTIAAPFYFVAVIAGIIGIRPTFTGAVCIIIVPLVFTLFSSVAGLFINLKLPVLNWINETQAVKQSASGMITMAVNMVVCIISGLIVIKTDISLTCLIMGIACIVALLLTYLFWKAALKIQIYKL